MVSLFFVSMNNDHSSQSYANYPRSLAVSTIIRIFVASIFQ